MRLPAVTFLSILTRWPVLLPTTVPFMVAGLLLGEASTSAAQTCTGNIPINVGPGDGSTPVTAHANVCAHNVTSGGQDGCFTVDWYSYTYCMQAYVNADFEFYAYDADYFQSPLTRGVHCTYNPPDPALCTGSVSISLYAYEGAVDGHVNVVPPPEGSLAGHTVWLQPPEGASYSATTDDFGYFKFREPGPNNWGVSVASGQLTASGPVSKTYEGGVDSQTLTSVTVTSSQLTTRDLTLWAPYVEEPSGRCGDPPSNNGSSGGEASTSSNSSFSPPTQEACCEVGKPVNVMTGNMYLDQTDITIPTVGQDLKFVRSYNTQDLADPQHGVFGSGWNHAYEQRLNVPATGIIMLRKGNGMPTYFKVRTDGVTYDPVVPFTLSSLIVKQGDGSYIRTFRVGGSESYDNTDDNTGRLTGLVDSRGNATTLTWEGSGPSSRLKTITDVG
jgi:YD repeat-containing protein